MSGLLLAYIRIYGYTHNFHPFGLPPYCATIRKLIIYSVY